jgi:uncharacterized beta-barrel protein YwiB (DUF1934 family)
MEKNLKIKVIDQSNEETLTNVIGEFSENNKEIHYIDGEVLVTIFISDEIVIERNHPDYYLTLIFNEKEKSFSSYEIKTLKINLDIEVKTIILKRFVNGFMVKYDLKINNEYVGSFEVNLDWD